MTEQQLRAICTEHAIPISIVGFIREADVARLLDVDIRTLQNWRRDLRGPQCVRMGGAWRYPVAALADFMTPTDEPRKQRKETEASVHDGDSPTCDHPADQPRGVES